MRSVPTVGGAGVPAPRPPPAALPAGAAPPAAPAGLDFRISSAVEPLLNAIDCALSHDRTAPVVRLRSSARRVLPACGVVSLPRPPRPAPPCRFAPGGATRYATQRASSENCGADARGIRITVSVDRFFTKSVSSTFRCVYDQVAHVPSSEIATEPIDRQRAYSAMVRAFFPPAGATTAADAGGAESRFACALSGALASAMARRDHRARGNVRISCSGARIF